MGTRIPASIRTREALAALIEGRLASPAGRSELVELATRLIVEEALAGEVRDALDRGYYERGDAPGQGHRNGHRTHRLKTAEGGLESSAPQVAGLEQPFRSARRDRLKGHTEALESLAVEMLARGMSVCDIEDAFKDETGRLLLSKTALAEIGKQLWEDYQAVRSRDLAEYDIAYLFIDGIAERIRPGQRREPVLAAWGFTFDGRKVLLHLMAGSKEDAETVSAFFQDMRARGLGDPLLVVSDGAAGIIKALEVCFPRSARQRCLAHPMRNLAAKVPEDLWPKFKDRATAAYQAPSRKIARELAEGVVADYGSDLANAVACFIDDFEACIAHLRLPVSHRRATRTTNLLERLFVEERRRLKIIPNAFGENAVLKLMFGAMTRAAERWRSIRVCEFERRQMAALKQELDHDYEAAVGLDPPRSKPAPSPKFPADLGLDQRSVETVCYDRLLLCTSLAIL
jgi:transposase-like protein